MNIIDRLSNIKQNHGYNYDGSRLQVIISLLTLVLIPILFIILNNNYQLLSLKLYIMDGLYSLFIYLLFILVFDIIRNVLKKNRELELRKYLIIIAIDWGVLFIGFVLIYGILSIL
jgi:chromate transport protein ChrA